MKIPKVSVCIDVYNYEAFLPDAIESVLGQDFSDFEAIIVDDCSDDGSFEIAKSYELKDKRVIARQNPANLGVVANRNACLRFARGNTSRSFMLTTFFAGMTPWVKWPRFWTKTRVSAWPPARCKSSVPR